MLLRLACSICRNIALADEDPATFEDDPTKVGLMTREHVSVWLWPILLKNSLRLLGGKIVARWKARDFLDSRE
jgi:hypothetical protein